MARKIFKGATVIDGTGAAPRTADVVVEGERIAFVGSPAEIANAAHEGATVIDLGGKYLTPGLMNHHEHLDNRRQSNTFQFRAGLPPVILALRGVKNALLSLFEGVTTIRDLGGKGATGIDVRNAINEGQFPGPRVFACGQPIAITGGHAWQICRVANGADEVRQAAREQLRAGADFVKLMASGGFVTQGTDLATSPQYSVAEIRAAVEEAHDAEKPTTVHAHPPVAIRRAIEAGIDCIEHAALLDRPTADLMAKSGTFLVPTLSESWIMGYRGTKIGRPQWLIDSCLEHLPQRIACYRNAVEAGVKMAVGTDVIGEMVEEMSLMAAGGLSNMQVLQAATRNGAELVRMADDLGTIEVGKLADMVVVSSDPIADLTAFRQIELTVKGGHVYDLRALVAQLGELAKPALELTADEIALRA